MANSPLLQFCPRVALRDRPPPHSDNAVDAFLRHSRRSPYLHTTRRPIKYPLQTGEVCVHNPCECGAGVFGHQLMMMNEGEFRVSLGMPNVDSSQTQRLGRPRISRNMHNVRKCLPVTEFFLSLL